MAAAPLVGLGALLAPGALSALHAGEAPAFSEEARRRLFGRQQGVSEQSEQARRLLLDEAEHQLATGRAEAALETLERAALTRHDADTELRIVRAHMALGQYRRALTFAAHTAGAHREQRAGVALYAWLLHIGGQEVVARRLLTDALRDAPGDALLAYTGDQMASAWPLAGQPLRQLPWQAAPAVFGATEEDVAPAGAAVVGSAMLLNHGRQAVLAQAPAGGQLAAHHDTRTWLRNGLGRTVAVIGKRPLRVPGLQLLELRERLASPGWLTAAREPFAGSPGLMVEYAPDVLGHAAWPVLRQGFFVGLVGTRTPRPLGLDAPRGPRGGPVFNASGRLVGVAGGSAKGDLLIGLSQLRELLDADALPEATAVPDTPSAQGGVGLNSNPELAYEVALRGALQVLAAGGKD